MDTSQLKSFSATGIKGAPIKGLNDHTLVLDLGESRELRVHADPSLLDTHTPPVLGDWYLIKGEEGAGCVVPRFVFESLFGADTAAELTELQRPETGPVPDDALGLTTQSLEAELKEQDAQQHPQEEMEKANDNELAEGEKPGEG